MALQGTLDTFALPDVLRLLAATKKSGRLRITGPRGAGSVWVAGGAVTGIEATHAPHATTAVDGLFELLRFNDGSFVFEADVANEADGPADEVEALLAEAEALLAEWREIEAVVPSLDAYVTLRRALAGPEITIAAEQWPTVVAVGAGATVRRIGDDLCLAEIPVSRAVRDLVDLGVVDVAAAAPAGAAAAPALGAAAPSPALEAAEEPVEALPAEQPITVEPFAAAESPSALDESTPLEAEVTPGWSTEEPVAELDVAPVGLTGSSDDDLGFEALPVAKPLRNRRPRGPKVLDEGPREPERFVPLELPGHQRPAPVADPEPEAEADEMEPAVDDLAAAFPGLANRVASPSPEEEELARQLAMLSPRAAEAVRAAAEAGSDEERDAALAEAEAGEDGPINRGLLLKFLSSVKS